MDAAAEIARIRGAPAAAAELLDLAAELGGDTPERRIVSARNHPSSYGRDMKCYLAEWYRAEMWQRESFSDNFSQLCRGARLTGDDRESATVLMTVSVPTDDAIFCVLAAPSAEAVATACDAAGLPPQRVTAAVAMDMTY